MLFAVSLLICQTNIPRYTDKLSPQIYKSLHDSVQALNTPYQQYSSSSSRKSKTKSHFSSCSRDDDNPRSLDAVALTAIQLFHLMNQMPSIEESAGKAPAPTPPLRIAVLINDFAIQIEDSFIRAINKACSSVPDSSTPFIDFFNPVKSQNQPEPAEYDLIVLSGGMVDPTGRDDWLLKLQEYIRKTVEYHPKQKVLGLGWGHLVMCVAFGGKLARLEEAEIGVRQMNLTAQGSKMFPFAIPQYRKIYIHEFHTREIRIPGHGFIPLAWGNKAFRNHANTILTLQGHPELDADSAKAVLDATIAPLEVGEAQKAKFRKWMEREHDNIKVWERILAWVKE